MKEAARGRRTSPGPSEATCSVEDCARRVKAKGLCDRHYLRQRRHGDDPVATRERNRGCAIEGCARPHEGRGWCRFHLRRFRASGDPLGPTKVTRYKGAACSVDGCETAAVSKGLCGSHYSRLRHSGQVSPEKPISRRLPKGTACSVDSCERTALARGWCEMHYERWKKHRNVRADEPNRNVPRKTCTIDGCTRTYKASGFCGMHWLRVWRHGNVNKGRSHRFVNPDGYVFVWVGKDVTRGGYMLEHRLVMSKHIGRPVTKVETVHHRNGRRDDNRLENLELWATYHSSGQRVADTVRWCREYLAVYGDLVDRMGW